MSEYLSKKAVLEWLKKQRKEMESECEIDCEGAYLDVIEEIQSGAFDADNTEIQRLRAALEWIVECGTDYQSINKARNALCEIKGGESDE